MLPDSATIDQSRSLIAAQSLHGKPRRADRACVPGDRRGLQVAIARFGLAFLAASPRFSIAALRSFGIAAFTASINDGSVASASAAIAMSTDWKRWKS